MPKAIVGLFCGTGYDFFSDEKAKNIDDCFQCLAESIATDDGRVAVHGYSGCHQRGGGINATGIEEPCDDLLQKIKQAHAKNPDEKLTVYLAGHSRGCLSAFLLIEKLNQDEELRHAVDIIGDFRDPVPGNIGLTTKLGSKIVSANRFQDMSHCTNVREVNFTMQEKGILNLGFDVLIPKFAPHAVVNVEYIPGLHDIQQDDVQLTLPDKTSAYYVRNHDIYRLGVYKSQQILHESGIHLLTFPDSTEWRMEQQAEIYAELLLQYQNDYSRMPADEFESLKSSMDQMLKEQFPGSKGYDPAALKIASRTLHFGGEFGSENTPATATALNARHAALAKMKDAKPLMGFKGNRLDILKSYDQHIQQELQLLENIPEARLADLFLFLRTANQPAALRCVDDAKGNLQKLFTLLVCSEKFPLETKSAIVTQLVDHPVSPDDVEYLRSRLASHTGALLGQNYQDYSLEFIAELRHYKVQRQIEDATAHFKSKTGRIPAKDKIKAVDKLINALEKKEDVKFTAAEIKALGDSRLGGIIDNYRQFGCAPGLLNQMAKQPAEVKAVHPDDKATAAQSAIIGLCKNYLTHLIKKLPDSAIAASETKSADETPYVVTLISKQGQDVHVDCSAIKKSDFKKEELFNYDKIIQIIGLLGGLQGDFSESKQKMAAAIIHDPLFKDTILSHGGFFKNKMNIGSSEANTFYNHLVTEIDVLSPQAASKAKSSVSMGGSS